MIRFRSKAGADILMLRAHADAVLMALGREPALEGILEGDGLKGALDCWALRPPPPGGRSGDSDEACDDDVQALPDLARRAWPLLQLLRRAQAARVPVTWSSN